MSYSEDMKKKSKIEVELEQYRAIGTVEEIKDILQIISEGQDDVDESGISTGLLHTLLEYTEYKKIGTVEECREAREKRIPIKPKGRYKTKYVWDGAYCPICECGITARWNFCQNCGQAVLWESDTP